MTTPLDAFDRKLLMEVQRDAHTPQNELGARVNLSTMRLADNPDQAQIDAIAADLDRLEREQAVMQAKLSEFPQYRALSTDTLSLQDLRAALRPDEAYLKLAPRDRVLGVLPLSFDYGQNQLLSAWHAGAAVAPLDYLTARDVVKAVARHRITTLAGVPPLWVQLVESDWPAETAALLERLTNSGGALTPSLIDRAVGSPGTARNWRTVQTLLGMLG